MKVWYVNAYDLREMPVEPEDVGVVSYVEFTDKMKDMERKLKRITERKNLLEEIVGGHCADKVQIDGE